MKRLSLALALPISMYVLAVPVEAAPGKNKKREQVNQPATPVPATPVAVAPVPAKPSGPDVSSPWHLWSDAQGRKIEAAFCALQGPTLTVKTREENIYRLNLNLLVPADRVFAIAYSRKAAENRFKDEYVKKSAYQIDFHIGSTLVAKGLKFNAPSNDEQFLRRIYLDAVGRIPTASEAAAFLADAAPNKRAKLIDSLLESPGYTMQMYDWMADMLRVKDDYGKGAMAYLFQDWLKDQFAADRPWDLLVRDMLSADGKLCENGATGFLLRDAQMPLDGMSNMLTTLLGANVACAQCHDHPLASWTQKDFYQMAAFFGATDGYQEGGLGKARNIGKKGLLGLNMREVVTIASTNSFRLIDEPKQSLKFPSDYKYDDAKPGSLVVPALIAWTPNGDKAPAYKISTTDPAKLRDEFAKWMTHPDNPRFAASIANRLWKKSFGLAVQEPVTDLDDPKKASNPALLAHITQIMKDAHFDLRQFQRVLFNSQTYQRTSSATPDLEKGPYLFPGPLVRRFSAAQAWDSILALAVGPEVDNVLLRRGEKERLLALPGNQFTPENLKVVADRMKEAGYSMGGGGGGKKGAGKPVNANDYEGNPPQTRFGLRLARASELPQPAPETHFLRLFGESDRLVADSNTTDGSVPQTLMLMNGPIAQMISESRCNAVSTAQNAGKPAQVVESLYLSFLGRKPKAHELSAAESALDSGLTSGDLAWTLLNLREFLFIE